MSLLLFSWCLTIQLQATNHDVPQHLLLLNLIINLFLIHYFSHKKQISCSAAANSWEWKQWRSNHWPHRCLLNSSCRTYRLQSCSGSLKTKQNRSFCNSQTHHSKYLNAMCTLWSSRNLVKKILLKNEGTKYSTPRRTAASQDCYHNWQVCSGSLK